MTTFIMFTKNIEQHDCRFLISAQITVNDLLRRNLFTVELHFAIGLHDAHPNGVEPEVKFLLFATVPD